MKGLIVIFCSVFLVISASASASQAIVDKPVEKKAEVVQKSPIEEVTQGEVMQGEDAKKITADILAATLIELIDQVRAVQQAHWNVHGSLFYSLHDMLGEFYDALNAKVDEIAERRLAIGFPADGRPSVVAAQANLGEIPTGMVKDKEALDMLSKRYQMISERLKLRITQTSNDLVTQGMLINLAEMIDKQSWMLRSFSSE